MSMGNICLNCGAEKSPGYEYACVSCGSKFEDQEMQYKTEREKRNRIRALTKLQKIEREKYFRVNEREKKKYLKSEESKRADRARIGRWLDLLFNDPIKGIFFTIITFVGFIALLIIYPTIGIIVLIIAVIIVVMLVAAYKVNKMNKAEERYEFLVKEKEEYLKSEEPYKYCSSCGDLVLVKFKTCPKCGHEFTNDN